MTKVLQVIQQGQFRGAEVFALDLSRELIRQGSWQVSVLSLFPLDQGYARVAAQGSVPLGVVEAEAPYRRFDVRLISRLRSMIEAGEYRIVQANGGATLKYLVAARSISRRSWKLVYRAIGMGSYWRRRWTSQYLYRWLLSQPHMVAAVSRAVADDLVTSDRVNPQKVVVIPSGVDSARATPEPQDRAWVRGALGVAPSELLLIYVGSLVPEKNLSALIEVVAACRQQGLPVKALILGAGAGREGLLADIRSRQLEEVVFIQSSSERVGRFLAGADLCVLPSLSEGMPMVLIEAGLAGVPAVAYAVGGIPEAVEHNVTGLLVPVNDLDALVGAVVELVRDSRRRTAMGAAARLRYQRFEIASVADGFSELYASLLTRESSSRNSR